MSVPAHHDPLGDATRRIAEGGLVAYPTETVWGLAADARSEAGLEALRSWKGRDAGQPISVLVDAVAALEDYGFESDGCAATLAKKFWPGPLTLVLRCRTAFARGVAREDGAVGVRCSAHPLAAAWSRRLRAEGAGPVTATSLNRAGTRAARTRREAETLCVRGPVGCESVSLLAVEGAEAGGDTPSTVLDLTEAEPRVLRRGAIPETELLSAIEEIRSR